MKRIFLALLAMASLPVTAHEPATAHYIGNEGVLISRGETKVLFDAFYRYHSDYYVAVDEQTKVALLDGRQPFDGADAVFVSHVHGDHFQPEPTIDYLKAQPKVRLYGSQQVYDKLSAALDPANIGLLERVTAIDLEPGQPALAFAQAGINIDVVAVPHAGGARHAEITNLVFRVQLDNATTVMHLGDADPNDSAFAPLQEHWDRMPLDLAMPPYWFFLNDTGQKIVDERLRPQHAIGIHVPAEAVGNGAAFRQRLGRDLFTDPGETRRFGAPEKEPKTP